MKHEDERKNIKIQQDEIKGINKEARIHLSLIKLLITEYVPPFLRYEAMDSRE